MKIDALHISAGNYGSYAQGMMIPPMATPEAPLVKYATKIKNSVKIPVITVGKIIRPEIAENIIKEKKADFIAIGRTLLADPEWPNKVKMDKIDNINNCICCNQGCISRLFAQQDVQCITNPNCGFEKDLICQPTKKPLKIIIAGGGPAGLYASYVLSQKGHKVTLFESDKKLGGLLNQAEIPPYRQGITTLKENLINNIKKTKTIIKTGQELNDKIIGKEKPDIIILATGSTATQPNIPGNNLTNVILSEDILTKKIKLKKKIIIAGGGCQGAQIADLLSGKKHQITIIELCHQIAAEMPMDEKFLLMNRLTKNKVKIHTNTKIVKFDPDGIIIQKGKGKTKIKADHIITCFGRTSKQTLLKTAQKHCKTVFNIGDSHKVSRIGEAIRQAAELCQKIK